MYYDETERCVLSTKCADHQIPEMPAGTGMSINYQSNPLRFRPYSESATHPPHPSLSNLIHNSPAYEVCMVGDVYIHNMTATPLFTVNTLSLIAMTFDQIIETA